MSKKEKPEIPSWAAIGGIVVVVLVAAYFLFARTGGGGPLPDSEAPAAARTPPTRPSYENSVGPGGPVGPSGGGSAAPPPGTNYGNRR